MFYWFVFVCLPLLTTCVTDLKKVAKRLLLLNMVKIKDDCFNMVNLLVKLLQLWCQVLKDLQSFLILINKKIANLGMFAC
jgi:hypothetical protein